MAGNRGPKQSGRFNSKIVLQCHTCGARAGLTSGVKSCAQRHQMVPSWIDSDRPLNEQELQENGLR